MADITTTFSDNVAITAEDMDNIALDLGATEFTKFSADTPFGNDALNGITADLVSSGILNLGDRCKCSLVTDDNGVTKINVATGVAVFGDGSKIRVTEPQTLDVIEGGTNYVYFKNDTISGKATLENSLTEPDVSTGYNLLLCTVTDDVLTDTRGYAIIKSSVISTAKLHKEITVEATLTVPKGGGSSESEIDIDVGDFPYTYIFQKNGLLNYNIREGKGLVYAEDSYTHTVIEDTALLYRIRPFGASYFALYFVSLSGSKLRLKADFFVSSTNIDRTESISCDFILI